MENKNLTITVPMLARVEGEGALDLSIENGKLITVKLNIYEPPRFFEKFLEGKHYTEVPEIVARICGICPVAYQMSAIHAFESLFETTTSEWVNQMRRVFYCGEWIESHSLHIHLLAAPDFLGFDSAPAMASRYPDQVKRGLQLQHLGNQIIKTFGGRSVHPIGACVGGFFRSPDLAEINELLRKIERGIVLAEQLVEWVSQLPLPESDQTFTNVSLHHGAEYPMNHGEIISSVGHRIAVNQFTSHFKEQHQPHSTALHCLLDGAPYLVGPLARINLNHSLLDPATKRLLYQTPLVVPSSNMFHSVIARALEIHYALIEAERILRQYRKPEKPATEVKPKSGVAFGCTEAPRGILWHCYETDSDGYVVSARITPPTSQNQARIEQDLRLGLNEVGLYQSDQILKLHAEKIIRNYDPCISCATHFLDLRVSRT